MSLNVKGLNSYVKLNKQKLEMKNNKIGIAFLQEMHLKINAMPKLNLRGYSTVYVSIPQEKKVRGTAILISDLVHWHYIEHLTDKLGRYIAVKRRINNKMYTLVSV